MPVAVTDQQGLELSGATPEAAMHYAKAVTAYNFFKGDPMGALDAATEAAPDFAMAHLLRAHLLALTTQADTTAAARRILDKVQDLPLADREAAHLRALQHLCRGDWTAAANALGRHLMDMPHDLVALQSAHHMDFFRGDAREMRDRIARALPIWAADMPGYSCVLGMYAFGLEEMGDYGRAEAMGREAVERDPRDSWAHHAVAHVYEMEGRASDGLNWMEMRAPHWASDDDYFQTHNWWHKALCCLELDDPAGALAVYDGQIWTGDAQVVFNLLDASALLWRLWSGGIDVGGRWQDLSEGWAPHLGGTGYGFNDWHAAMALLGSGAGPRVDAMIAVLQNADPGTEAGRWQTTITLPLIEGFRAFAQGRYEEAADTLFAVRRIAHRFGGSHAQRDVIDWTLAEAALRGGLSGMARALADERVALRPHSPVNRAFLARAKALEAAGSG